MKRKLKKCSNCGFINPDNAIICSNCGNQLNTGKKKYIISIILLLVVILTFSVLLAGMFKKGQTSSIEKTSVSYTNGDLVYSPQQKNISFDEDTCTIYYDNMLIVYLKSKISDLEANELAEQVDGIVVGYIKGCVNVLQIMVKSTDLNTLNTLSDILMDSDRVLYATYDFPIDIQEGSVSEGDASLSEHRKALWGGEVDLGNEEHPNGKDWWAEAIGAYTAWEYSEGLTNPITVGILDSGFDIEHEDFINDDGSHKLHLLDGYEENSVSDHGTSVAGLVGAVDNEIGIRGVADKASLLCVDWSPITNNEQEENYINLLSSGEYIEITKQMIEQGAKVINNSWCAIVLSKNQYVKQKNHQDITDYPNLLSFTDIISKKYDKDYSSYLRIRKKRAEDTAHLCINLIVQLLLAKKDFLIVQSSGNGYGNLVNGTGHDAKLSGYYCAISEETLQSLKGTPYIEWLSAQGITYNIIKDHIMIVGAIEMDDVSYQLTTFSNYGDAVDIVAPGNNVYSTATTLDDYLEKNDTPDGEIYYYTQGTSMSAPIVSGSAALVWSMNPNLTAPEIKEILINTAGAAVGVTEEDKGRTYPMLNVGKAVENAIGATHVEFKRTYTDMTYHGYETTGEYVTIRGIGVNGGEIWTYKTNTYPCGTYGAVVEIGLNNDIYYISESGTVVAFQLADGVELWRNENNGVVSGFDFGTDGTLYLCSYDGGPDFAAIDTNGNSLKKIDSFDKDYYWPYQVEYLGDKVSVTFEGSSNWFMADAVFYVNLNDYSYYQEITDEMLYLEYLEKRAYTTDIPLNYNNLQYSILDVNSDGIQELIIYCASSDDSTQYFLVYTIGQDNVVFTGIIPISFPIDFIYYSDTEHMLVKYARTSSDDHYFFYQLSGVELNYSFYVRRDHSSSLPAPEYYYTTDPSPYSGDNFVEIGEKDWDKYTNNLEKVQFKDIPLSDELLSPD